jgi:hypothetical protein
VRRRRQWNSVDCQFWCGWSYWVHLVPIETPPRCVSIVDGATKALMLTILDDLNEVSSTWTTGVLSSDPPDGCDTGIASARTKMI